MHFSAVKRGSQIEVYSIGEGELKRHAASEKSHFRFEASTLCPEAQGTPATVGLNNVVHVFFKNKDKKLVHASVPAGDEAKPTFKVFDELVNNESQPVALFSEPHLEAFFFSPKGELVRLSNATANADGWQREVLYDTKCPTAGELQVLRASKTEFDAFYVEECRLHHLYQGQRTQGVLKHAVIFGDGKQPIKCVRAIRVQNATDVFYVDEQGQVCQMYCNAQTKYKFVRKGRVVAGKSKTAPAFENFSVVRAGAHIDLYYTGADHAVHHVYSGLHNDWKWSEDEVISPPDVASRALAFRDRDEAIDVFYFDQKHFLVNLFIGERTGENWEAYESNVFVEKPATWELLQDKSKLLGEGYHAKGYLVTLPDREFVVKLFKGANPAKVRREIAIAQKLEALWPKFFLGTVMEKGILAGYAMPYFKGKLIDAILQDKNSMLYKNTFQRLKLLKKLAKLVQKLQKLGICHGDLSLNNIIVMPHPNKPGEEHFKLAVIDYGEAKHFEKGTTLDSTTTGWDFLCPPEAKKDKAYSPVGVNAYQFARVAAQVLNTTLLADYPELAENFEPELTQLKKSRCGEEVVDFIAACAHPDLAKRNVDLNGYEKVFVTSSAARKTS